MWNNRIWTFTVFLFLILLALLPFITAEESSDPGWGVAVNIEFDEQNSGSYPVVAMDQYGNAHAVWVQSDGTHARTMASRYIVGYGWTAPVKLSSINGNTNFPKVVCDNQGNALAVWRQATSTYDSIYSCYFKAGKGWGNAEAVETGDDGDANSISLGMDSSGKAIAVWVQDDGVRNNIYSNIYTPGAGWGSVQLVETGSSGSAGSPQIAVNPAGTAIAVWRQSDGSNTNGMANIYLPGSGWGTEAVIDSNDAGVNIIYPAIDPDGNAVAVWQQSDGTSPQLFTNRFTPGVGWGTDSIISNTSLSTIQYPRVVYLGSGKMIAAWAQWDGIRYNLYYSIGTPSGWTTAEYVENADEPAWEPELATDGLGNARMIWTENDGYFTNTVSAGYTTEEGWTGHQILELNPGNIQAPEIAMSPNGDAVAVWYQTDGTIFDIWANRYEVPDLEPPVLSLTSPEEGLIANIPIVKVYGTTEPGAHVVVNGVVAESGDGDFSIDIPLYFGMNTIKVTATDASGNSATTTRHVEYVNPLGAIEEKILGIDQDIESIRENLSSLQDEALWENVTSLFMNLNDTMNDIEELKGILNGTLNDIEDLGEILNDMDANDTDIYLIKSMLGLLEEEVNSTSNELAAVYDDLSMQQDQMDGIESDVDSLQDQMASGEDDDDDEEEENYSMILFGINLALIIILFILVIMLFGSRRGRKKDPLDDAE